MEGQSWTGNGIPTVPGHGLRGAVVGWYLPVLVVTEEQMKSVCFRLKVLMKRVAVDRQQEGLNKQRGSVAGKSGTST